MNNSKFNVYLQQLRNGFYLFQSLYDIILIQKITN